MTRITLGYDPEVHLWDNKRGQVVSAIPVLKRDKYNPIILGETKLYADNVLAEFAHPPSFSPQEAVDKFRKIFSDILNFLGPRYSLLAQAAVSYPKEELDHPDAWKIGCDANFDAYREAANEKLSFADGLRTGSFHVHLGHEKLASMFDKVDFIKVLDIILGSASVLFDKDPSAPARRKYYGRAGEFRATEYGIEYRVMGNYPLRSSELTRLAFDLVGYAATHIENKTVKDVLAIPNIQQKAQLAINGNEKTVAERVLSLAGLPAALLMRVKQDYVVTDIPNGWALA